MQPIPRSEARLESSASLLRMTECTNGCGRSKILWNIEEKHYATDPSSVAYFCRWERGLAVWEIGTAVMKVLISIPYFWMAVFEIIVDFSNISGAVHTSSYSLYSCGWATHPLPDVTQATCSTLKFLYLPKSASGLPYPYLPGIFTKSITQKIWKNNN